MKNKSKNRHKKYSIMAKVEVDCYIEISASNLEDAVIQSKNLTEENFVTVNGDLNDSTFEVYGIFENTV